VNIALRLIEERLKQHRENLEGWSWPDPDQEVRLGLRATIAELEYLKSRLTTPTPPAWLRSFHRLDCDIWTRTTGPCSCSGNID
jgi:hypothetical protein